MQANEEKKNNRPTKKSRRSTRIDPNQFEIKQPLVISFYSHKGGVGKTTILHNFAECLLRSTDISGIDEIIMIDADPQMNLSSVYLDSRDFDDHISYLDKTSTLNLNDAEDKRVINDNVRDLFMSNRAPAPRIIKSHNGRTIKLFKGSPEQSDYYAQLAVEEKSPNKPSSNKIINDIKNLKNGKRLILIDLNPSLNIYNRVILSACDFLVIPTNTDLFSQMGIKQLKKNYFDTFWSKYRPKVLGYVVNRAQRNNKTKDVDLTKDSKEASREINLELKHIENSDNLFLGFVEELHGLGWRVSKSKKSFFEYQTYCPRKDIARISDVCNQVDLITKNILKRIIAVQLIYLN